MTSFSQHSELSISKRRFAALDRRISNHCMNVRKSSKICVHDVLSMALHVQNNPLFNIFTKALLLMESKMIGATSGKALMNMTSKVAQDLIYTMVANS